MSDALARLEEITRALARLYREEAMLLQQERRARIEAWMRSEATSVAARERDMDVAAVEITCAIFDVRGQIRSLQEERDHLRLRVSRGLDDGAEPAVL